MLKKHTRIIWERGRKNKEMPQRKITPLLFKKIYGKLPNDNEWKQFEKNYRSCVMTGELCSARKGKKLSVEERKEIFMGKYKKMTE